MSNDEPTIPEARTTEAISPSALPDGDVVADTTIANSGNNEVASTVGVVVGTPTARTVPPYIPFPIWTLPESVRKFVLATAAAIGCDVAFVALPILAALARVIGNRRKIGLKSTWSEPAIIWGAIVARTGSQKSPALQAATAFLQELEQRAYEEFQQELANYRVRKAAYEQEVDASGSLAGVTVETAELPPEEPSCLRYVTTDITIAALTNVLAHQFDGVLVVRDELAGFVNGVGEFKAGKGSDLGHWLASWSAMPITVDRKVGEQKTLRVPRAAVSIIGGIQPNVLRAVIGREHLQDGLCARFLLTMPDTRPIRWSEDTVSPETTAALDKLVARLLALKPADDGAGNLAPQILTLSEQAKAVWVAYYDQHQAKKSELDEDRAAAWSKLEAYAARFALIFQLCSWAGGEAGVSAELIEEAAMMRAVALSNWFGYEARRVYGLFAENQRVRDNRELVEQIRRRGGSVTVRELMRSSRRYRTAALAEAALIGLVLLSYGCWKVIPAGPKGGQPTRRFKLIDTVDGATTDEDTENGEVVSTQTQSVAEGSSAPSGELGAEEISGPDDPDLDLERQLSEEFSGLPATEDNESCVIGGADGKLLSYAEAAGNDAERGGV